MRRLDSPHLKGARAFLPLVEGHLNFHDVLGVFEHKVNLAQSSFGVTTQFTGPPRFGIVTDTILSKRGETPVHAAANVPACRSGTRVVAVGGGYNGGLGAGKYVTVDA